MQNTHTHTNKVLEAIGKNKNALRFRYNQKYYEKKKKENLNLTEIKHFCSVKDTLKRMKRKVTHWEKISEKNTSDKRTDELYEGLKT